MEKVEKLKAIEEAMAELILGKRVNSVAHGDMKVQYSDLSLDDLFKLRSRVLAGTDIDGNPGKRQVRFSTSKGLK